MNMSPVSNGLLFVCRIKNRITVSAQQLASKRDHPVGRPRQSHSTRENWLVAMQPRPILVTLLSLIAGTVLATARAQSVGPPYHPAVAAFSAGPVQPNPFESEVTSLEARLSYGVDTSLWEIRVIELAVDFANVGMIVQERSDPQECQRFSKSVLR
jgi:hypothetical protein